MGGQVMEKATFTIDDMVDVDGIHNPQKTWNGWACPLFPIDSVRIIAEWVESLGVQGVEDFAGAFPKVDESGRVFWVNYNAGTEIVPVSVGGVDYFDIGAYGWIWSVKDGAADV